MKRTLAIFCFSLLSQAAPVRGQAGAPPEVLSDLEAAVVREQNLARTSPSSYADLLSEFRSLYDGLLIRRPGKPAERTREGVAAVEEAIEFLRSIEPLPPLRVSRGMSFGARDHVVDQGPRGTVGHVGADSSQVWDRVSRYGRWFRSVAENIAYGPGGSVAAARHIVTQLIVDDGVAERGHREAMFDPDFGVVGIACGPHASYRHMCVLTYAADYRDD